MKSKWKILIGCWWSFWSRRSGVYASTVYSKNGVVTVQTGEVVRQDLTSLVTASGEIKPKNYINIGANAIGEHHGDAGEGRRPRPQGPVAGADRGRAAGSRRGGAEGDAELAPKPIPTPPRPG